jgi:hypothetical protein
MKAVVILLSFCSFVSSFDTTLDTHRESRRWKFTGNYTYANSSSSSELRKHVAQTPASTGEFEREGIWMIKHDDENQGKTFEIKKFRVEQIC